MSETDAHADADATVDVEDAQVLSSENAQQATVYPSEEEGNGQDQDHDHDHEHEGGDEVADADVVGTEHAAVTEAEAESVAEAADADTGGDDDHGSYVPPSPSASPSGTAKSGNYNATNPENGGEDNGTDAQGRISLQVHGNQNVVDAQLEDDDQEASDAQFAATLADEETGDGAVAHAFAVGNRPRAMLRQMSSFAAWQVGKAKKEGCFGQTKRALFCWVVLVVCVVMMFIEMAEADWEFEDRSVNPLFGPNANVLLDLGAKRTDLILDGDWWRLIAPMFLHGGFLHLLFNMFALVNVGFPLEHDYGHAKVAYIYLASGFIGVLFSSVFDTQTVGVGASGAIFGLFGAAWGDLVLNWSLYKQQGFAKKLFAQLFVTTIINLGLGTVPFLDNFAHVGGFIAGIMTGLTVLHQERFTRYGEKKMRKTYVVVLQVIFLCITPLSIIIGLAILYFGVDLENWCSWCRFVSCVPMPFWEPQGERLWDCDDCTIRLDPSTNSYNPETGELSVACPNGEYEVATGQFEGDSSPTIKDLIKLCREECDENGGQIK